MHRPPDGHLTWVLADLAKALRIPPEEVREYFTDGRRISFILERRVAREVLGGALAASEGADHDLTDAEGGKWEVRSITKGGIYFSPSYMVGKGRDFEDPGFFAKTDKISGYILFDIESFPDVPFWFVSSAVVRGWWEQGRLGAGTKISRKQALALLKEEQR